MAPTFVLIVQLDLDEAVDEAVRVLERWPMALAQGPAALASTCYGIRSARTDSSRTRRSRHRGLEEHKPAVREGVGAFDFSLTILKKHRQHSPVDFEGVYETDLRAKL